VTLLRRHDSSVLTTKDVKENNAGYGGLWHTRREGGKR
jgi:hypothetical protein